MYEQFDKLSKLLKENAGVKWNLACEWLLHNGFATVSKWTDEFIKTTETPELIDPDFYVEILKLARTIATEFKPSEFMQFCMTVPFYSIDNFSGKLNRDELEDMVKASVQADLNGYVGDYSVMHMRDLKNVNDIQYFCERYDCDADAFETLGFEVTEEYSF